MIYISISNLHPPSHPPSPLPSSDPESGISVVSLALGRSQRDTALLPWTDISPPGGAPSASGGGVRLTVIIPDGIPAWVKLRVTNNGEERHLCVCEYEGQSSFN